MHAAMIIDGDRLQREHGMLRRLAIGMVSEGIELTRIIPVDASHADVLADEQKLALTNRIEIEMPVVPWLRWRRRMQLHSALEKSVPDVIYAVGSDAWPVGLDLAEMFDRPLALDVWCAGQIHRVPTGARAGHIGAYVAATSPIADALRARVPPELVSVVRYGVPMVSQDAVVQDQGDEVKGIAIIGSGRDIPAYRALLTGLSRLLSDMPDIEVFLELRGRREHDIWQHIDRLDLLDRISSLPDAAHHRALFVQVHALVMVERLGEVRSLTLDAMAHGVPIIAAVDHHLDYLVPDETAILVDAEDANAWQQQLHRALTDTAFRHTLMTGAREWVQRRHQSNRHAAALVECLCAVRDGASLPFGRSKSADGG